MTTYTIPKGGARTAVEWELNRLDVEKAWDITIEPHRKRRTLSQNALYWKWVGEVAGYVSQATGYEPDEVHSYFKGRFLDGKDVDINGYSVTHRTTTTLTTAGMASFMDRIFRWATTELGLTLPLPPIRTEER